MSKRKTTKIVEIVIIVLLLLGTVLAAIYFFGRVMMGQMNVAGAAAGESAVSGSGQRAAETTNADGDYECRDVKEIREKFSPASVREGCASPSFRGRGARGNPPQVGASHVEDDGPIPPDGGGMPSKELKPIRKTKGVCAPGGPNSDF